MPRPLRVDGGVDADDLPVQVEERAAAVAGVDRRVGLDEVVVGAGADRARLGAHDAHRDGVAEAERIADGDDVFADAQTVRSSRARPTADRARPHELEHGEVELRVAPARPWRRTRARRRSLTLDLIGVFDDVRVGDDVTRSVDDEPRPERSLAKDLVAAPVASAAGPSRAGEDAERVETERKLELLLRSA